MISPIRLVTFRLHNHTEKIVSLLYNFKPYTPLTLLHRKKRRRKIMILVKGKKSVYFELSSSLSVMKEIKQMVYNN